MTAHFQKSSDVISGIVDYTPQESVYRSYVKRIFDIAFVLASALVVLPVTLILALLVMTDGHSPFYTQERVGRDGRVFRMVKLRSMVKDADHKLAEYLARNEAARDEWNRTQKLKRDPRLTVPGSLLRKSSLDELPQLFNILRGDMSCVGPRPIVAEELRRYGPVAKDYLRTRPGLTGLWQVTGRDSVDYAGRVLLDAQYVRNWSLRTDVLILVRTAGAVMKFDRAS